jgi:hypothetical protein
VRIPKPPAQADVNLIHRHLRDLYTYLATIHEAGSQAISLTPDQINSMTSPDHFGKRVANSDTGKQMISELNTGKTAVTWKAI